MAQKDLSVPRPGLVRLGLQCTTEACAVWKVLAERDATGRALRARGSLYGFLSHFFSPPRLPLLALWSWSSLIFLCYLICSKLKQSSRTPLPASLSFSKQNRCKFSNFLTAMRGWHFQVASSILVWLCQGCVNVDDLRKKMHETQIKSHLQRLRQSFRAWSTEEALPISGYIQLCSILSMWSHDKLFETCFTSHLSLEWQGWRWLRQLFLILRWN